MSEVSPAGVSAGLCAAAAVLGFLASGCASDRIEPAAPPADIAPVETPAPASVVPTPSFPVLSRLRPPEIDDEGFLGQMALSVVRLELLDESGTLESGGVAFFVAPGILATARHCIEGARSARIRFATGPSFPVVGVQWLDDKVDLALLAVETPGLEPVPLLIQEEPPRAGDRLVGVAPPEPGESGCMASYGRLLPDLQGTRGLNEGIRLRMTVAPGWSGAPVLSSGGEVVGLLDRGMQASYALAVPAPDLRRALVKGRDRAPEALPGMSTRGAFGRARPEDDEQVECPPHLYPVLAARGRGDLEGASKIAMEITAQKPGDGDAWMLFAILLGEQGKVKEAIAALRRVCDIQPGSARAFAALGSALMEAKLHAEAVPAFRESVRLNAKDTDAHYYLAYALMELGHFEESILEYRAVLLLDPTYTAAKQGIDYAEYKSKLPR